MSTGIFHIPVMAEAAVAFLLATPSGPIVDATLGGGGHTSALLAGSASERRVIAVDQDQEALAEAKASLAEQGTAERCTFIHGNFRDLPTLLPTEVREHGVSGILADLGVSSHQLDAADRGFGLKHASAPLDMRMDPSSSSPTAAEYIAENETETYCTWFVLVIVCRLQLARDGGSSKCCDRTAARCRTAVSAVRKPTCDFDSVSSARATC